MRCINCQNLSFRIICKRCKEVFYQENIKKRVVEDVDVISLFGYSQVEPLILSKYHSIGYRLYRYFSKEHILPFLEVFAKNYPTKIYLIGIDEVPNIQGYSHTSVLAHYSQTENITHLHSVLIAKNRVSYAKKSREFRLKNSRDFIYTGAKNIEVILIDDVITTGSTISQAVKVLRDSEVDVAFVLTLADAKR
jgi:competence protein ComFC